MFPNLCDLYICGVEEIDSKDKLDYWDYVNGYKMSVILRSILRELVIITYINCETIVTASCLIEKVDILIYRKQEFTFCSPFHLEVIMKIAFRLK